MWRRLFWAAAAVGHTDKVYAVAWSPVDPHVLVSGGDDGTIRLWDVRRGGGGACLLTFNQHSTAGGARSFGASQRGGHVFRSGGC